MAVSSNAVFIQTPKITPQRFVKGDGQATFKTLYTAGSNGSKIVAISAVNGDTSNAHLLSLVVTRSAVDYTIGKVIASANSGANGSAIVCDVLRGGANNHFPSWPIDNDGNPYFFLNNGDTLRMAYANNVMGSSVISVITVGGDF